MSVEDMHNDRSESKDYSESIHKGRKHVGYSAIIKSKSITYDM